MSVHREVILDTHKNSNKKQTHILVYYANLPTEQTGTVRQTDSRTHRDMDKEKKDRVRWGEGGGHTKTGTNRKKTELERGRHRTGTKRKETKLGKRKKESERKTERKYQLTCILLWA